jgi:hypothetical protein
MSAHKAKVALAATSQALQDARAAANHFAARCTDPDAKSLMTTLLDHHLTAINRLRVQLLSSLPPSTPDKQKETP